MVGKKPLSRDEQVYTFLESGKKRWKDLEEEFVNKSRMMSTTTLSRVLKDLERTGKIRRDVDDTATPPKTWYEIPKRKLGLVFPIDNNTKVARYRSFLENFLRNFVGEKLKEHYKKDWWKDGVPYNVRRKCYGRKREDIEKGLPVEEKPLIDFSDFSDYIRIFFYRGNWNDVFERYYGQETFHILKKEIFPELIRIRIREAHSQPISDEDVSIFEVYALKLICVEEDKNKFKELLKSWKISPSLPKIELPTIQSILSKEKISTADFFKKEPEWIDFEENYIIERKEVDMIVNNLEENSIQLVLGNPASGKSVILKNIGFKLVNQGWKVYIIEPKKYDEDRISQYFEDIPKIDDEKTLIIIDDAHLDLPACKTLVRDFKIKNSNSKLIIGSRKVKRIMEEHPKEPSPLEDLFRTEIFSVDIAEELIHRFLNKKYGLDDKEIKIVSNNLERYKYDLWILSWALKSYILGEREVEESNIYNKISYSIKNIRGQGESRINAEDALLPLSVLYRFEIPVEKTFLERQMEIKSDLLNQLIAIEEIDKREWLGGEMLSLHHSSIAELYYETYKYYRLLGKKTKNQIKKRFSEWDIGLIHLYFQSKPEMCVSSLSKLSNAYEERLIKRNLISNLLRNEETKKRIFEKIIGSMRVRNVNNVNDVLQKVSDRVFNQEFLKYFTQEELLEFLNNSKLNQIGHFLGWRGYYSFNVQRAYQRFSRESFLIRKMKEATLDEIRVFIRQICNVKFKRDSSIGRKLARHAVEKLKEINNLPQKLEDATIGTIRLLIKNINDINGNPEFIIDRLRPLFNLIPKLTEGSLNDINMLIMSIDRANTTSKEPEPNSRFVIGQIKQMNQNELIHKIDRSTLQYINHFITNIKRNDVESSNYVFELIKQIDFTEKLKGSKLMDLTWFLWNISDDSSLSIKYTKIVNNFDLIEKIEESDFDSVNYLIWNLLQISLTAPKIFTDEDTINILINRLNEENESIGEKLRLIGIFKCAGYSILGKNDEKALATKILRSELENWFKEYHDRPFKIALALEGFRTIDEKKLISFISSYTLLKDIINYLKKAEIKNRKSEELIVNTLNWFNNLQ